MIEKILRTIERFIPRRVYRFFQPVYHFSLALTGALLYRFPSKKITVILVTGTKGKTSTAEFLNSILETAGEKTALLGTLRFKVGEKNERNMRKMTIPGRFFVQHFLRRAVNAGCTYAIIEMTSEGARQFRHLFIDMDALIFTNLSPEHIESHGSYENYRDAKVSIARALARSSKPHHYMIGNGDDKESAYFFIVQGVLAIPFHLKEVAPITLCDDSGSFNFHNTEILIHLPGKFNIQNALAAATCAEKLGISLVHIQKGLSGLIRIAGRTEIITDATGLRVVVDYAHTPDSLEAIYSAFSRSAIIGVLGNTGGGRDKWKRPIMGSIAGKACTYCILTNEDPYDEDPHSILISMEEGVGNTPHEVILDRREAIRRAIHIGRKDPKKNIVIITGKGTDPYIMGPNGSKMPWDDRTVVKEELN